MTIPSNAIDLNENELAEYGVQRARDEAFAAVHGLWLRRRDEGMKQKDLASKIGRDRGWVSKCFGGPANWTFRTFGELAAGLGGEIEIRLHALEDPISGGSNYDAWDDYDASNPSGSSTATVKVELVYSQ